MTLTALLAMNCVKAIGTYCAIMTVFTKDKLSTIRTIEPMKSNLEPYDFL